MVSGSLPNRYNLMKFSFTEIPEMSKLVLVDNLQKESVDFDIPTGDSEVEYEVPKSWQGSYVIRTVKYYIPDSYVQITDTGSPISVSGKDYYLDINRPAEEVEQQWNSVEDLIVAINRTNLEPRQKFYTGLLSLNSYCEFLVHAMIVRSGHMSKTKFDNLNTHEERISCAFDKKNKKFFAKSFYICPGKSCDVAEMRLETRSYLKLIMNELRKLRNDVAHSWGYREVSEERIIQLFKEAEHNLQYTSNAKDFFEAAAQGLIAIYCKIKNPLGDRYNLLSEREAVSKDREDRGYK